LDGLRDSPDQLGIKLTRVTVANQRHRQSVSPPDAI